MVTLKDIAQRANVSVRSVSIVLNGKAIESRISSPVANKIQEIASQLNYRPNAMARATRLKRTKQIGVLVSELSNPQTGRVIEIIEKTLTQHGYRLLLGLAGKDERVIEGYLAHFSSGTVDGILNCHPLINLETFHKMQVQVPYVLYMRSSPGVSISLDFNAGVNLAMDHLWDLGHRQIGFLSGLNETPDTDERLQAFIAYTRQRNIDSGNLIEYGDFSFASGQVMASRLLGQPVTAIFAGDDLIAVGALKTVRSMGFRVPQDISIVGFDDCLLAEMSDPPLTSVKSPTDELARLTVEALVAKIDGQDSAISTIITPTLTVRASTAACSPQADRTPL